MQPVIPAADSVDGITPPRIQVPMSSGMNQKLPIIIPGTKARQAAVQVKLKKQGSCGLVRRNIREENRLVV